MKRIVVVIAYLCASFCSAQEATPTFAVASIRPNIAARFGKLEFLRGGRLRAVGVNLYQLVNAAYGLTGTWRIAKASKCPAWIDTERFDIDAVAEEGAVPDPVDALQLRKRMEPMLQHLLAERFQLVISRVSKEMPVYSLTVGKSGPTLTPATITEAECRVSIDCHRFIGNRMAGLKGDSVTIADLAYHLETTADRPIVDETGLQGPYAIQVEPYANLKTYLDDFRASMPPGLRVPEEPPLPSLSSVLEKNLGLLLRRTRAQIEVVQIESVSRPSVN